MPSISETRHLLSAWLTPIMRYERHISAAAMVAGFAIDNYSFGRVDRPATHIVFGAYLAIAIGAIAMMHAVQAAADRYKVLHEREIALAARRRRGLRFALAPRRAKSPSPGSAPVVTARIEPRFAATSDEGSAPRIVTAPSDAVAPAESAPAPEAAKTGDEATAKAQPRDPRRTVLLAATQFALGGLSSGFLVFYSRSAAYASSWLFLLVLVSFLIGNEIFKKYHSRLVFSALLLFFSLYSYAIFVVPVVTRTIGKAVFLTSGAIAIIAFLLFLNLLSRLGRERFHRSRIPILAGMVAITVAMNAFYFTNLLPPLPLALADVGIYHSVKRNGPVYVAVGESQSWYATLGFEPEIMHVVPGEPLSLYTAIFAPVKLATRITHLWQHYDPDHRRWTTFSTVSFPISGGREGGYRAYSIKSKPKPGDWRVDITTDDGRLVGRLRFVVVNVPKEAVTITKTMQ